MKEKPSEERWPTGLPETADADFPTTPQGREALEECIKFVRLQILHYQDMERKLMYMRAASGKASDDGREEDSDARS